MGWAVPTQRHWESKKYQPKLRSSPSTTGMRASHNKPHNNINKIENTSVHIDKANKIQKGSTFTNYIMIQLLYF